MPFVNADKLTKECERVAEIVHAVTGERIHPAEGWDTAMEKVRKAFETLLTKGEPH